uniref:GDSL esterase/lipase n=1 Tax=Oryza punctata TaxID=4537 RepID=A0A0E0JLT2_ORYPU
MDELENLRKLHLDVAIIYADYYGAAMEIFLSPEQFGIENPLVACCGGGGPYGVSETARCGHGEYKVCDDPQLCGSWDGYHPSEAVFKAIAIGLLRGSYTQPPLATTTISCPQITELGSSVEYKVLYDLRHGGCRAVSPSAAATAPFVLLLCAVVLLNAHVVLCGCYKRIFSFGDSIIDTGNFVYLTGNGPSQFKELPYGMTYFNRPSGRICDGRVLVDFYAQALNLSLLPSSMPEEGSGQFENGANFAVLASTALGPDYFKTKYNFSLPVPYCLDSQLASFKKVLGRIAPGVDATKSLLGESLIVMGEIGGNDYNFWFTARQPRETAKQYLPDVIGRIGAAVQEVINLGAKTVLVPGNFPFGCAPEYLQGFQSSNTSDYDATGCIAWFNDFSRQHNQALVQEVGRLRSQNPGVTLIYADYYGAALEFFKNPKNYGIADPLLECCGGDGPYHTGMTCNKTAKVWGPPANFANWDGVHMTEKAYSIIADGVLSKQQQQPLSDMGSFSHQQHSIPMYLVLVSAVLLLNSTLGLCGCYKSIFSFGDSIIDSGNFVHIAGDHPCPFKEPPFGMTYFKHPSGRISDGRVVIDFYAQALQLPFIPPSLPEKDRGQFPHGANFAVLASTALPPEYFRRWNHTVPMPFSLATQLEWFKQTLHRIAPGDAARTALLGESLILMGEIGGNDYNFWFLDHKPRELAYQFIPDVVASISSTVQELIGLGARTIVIPGNFPTGCVPAYLSAYRSGNPADYDELRCLRWFNAFSAAHNQALTNEVSRLKAQHPGVRLIYADYFGAALQLFRNPRRFGINDPLIACCGGHGPYHTGATCDRTATVWGDPGSFANWDGVHMTEKAYHVIADGTAKVWGPPANFANWDGVHMTEKAYSIIADGAEQQQPLSDMGSFSHQQHSIPMYLVLVSAVLLLNSTLGLCGCYKSIFSFGDSIIDSGNFVHIAGDHPCPFKEPPFGMTYFKHPSGRISDGRVVIDFYAQALQLPFIPPSLPEKDRGQFPHGANFAVLASTALPPEYFRRWNHTVPMPFSLATQLEWFKQTLHRIAPGDAARTALLGESLILMGEIGGNDYNFWFLDHKPRELAYQFIPDVVASISSTVQELIGLGARTIVIPGNFPTGCVPAYLSAYRSGNPADYDELRCLRWFNAFSAAHNQALTNEVSRLKAQHPGVRLIYADYFGAALQLFRNPRRFGINDPLIACCGGHGPYHTGATCDRTATVWGDPGSFANWDGVHMTEKAYHVIADGVLNGPFADPPLLHSC